METKDGQKDQTPSFSEIVQSIKEADANKAFQITRFRDYLTMIDREFPDELRTPPEEMENLIEMFRNVRTTTFGTGRTLLITTPRSNHQWYDRYFQTLNDRCPFPVLFISPEIDFENHVHRVDISKIRGPVQLSGEVIASKGLFKGLDELTFSFDSITSRYPFPDVGLLPDPTPGYESFNRVSQVKQEEKRRKGKPPSGVKKTVTVNPLLSKLIAKKA